jgi:hypothetical protein
VSRARNPGSGPPAPTSPAPDEAPTLGPVEGVGTLVTPLYACARVRATRIGPRTEFRRGRGITVAGTPERGIVVIKARELVELGRKHGYRPDELVEIIEGLA